MFDTPFLHPSSSKQQLTTSHKYVFLKENLYKHWVMLVASLGGEPRT